MSDDLDTARERLADLHTRLGFGALLLFAVGGLGLESLHGLKTGWYVDADQSTRRLMLTLCHVHGTLLGLVNVAWGVAALQRMDVAGRFHLASSSLRAGTVLMPLGFLLGGLWIHDGDPGLGIVLVPLGALAVIACLAITFVSLRRR